MGIGEAETAQLVVEGEETEKPPPLLVSFGKIYWVGFLFHLENNVILPTIWEYVRKHFESSIIMYGGILSLSAIAEVLGALVLGFWSDRRPLRYPLIAALVFFIIGNFLYISAWNLSVWVIFLARFIAGLGYGGASIVLAYITHHSSAEQRNHKIAMYWLTCLSTNIVGPLVTYIINVSKIGYHNDTFLNEMTYPAVFNIVFYTANALAIFFQWPSSVSHHASEKSAEIHMDAWGIAGLMSLARSVSTLAFVCLYIKLVFSLLVSVFQAIASPITDQDTSTNSLLFIAIGSLIMFGVVLAKLINRKVSDYNTLQIGQVAAFISLFGLMHWGIPDQELQDSIFGLASIVLTLGNSIGITICTAAYSKAIGQYHPRKGVLMGWFITAAAVGRVIGPILSCIGLQTVGLNVVGGVLIGMSLVAIILLSYCRVRMRYIQIQDTNPQ